VYLTEVWIEAVPSTSHLWIVLRKDAKSREGCSTYGAALTVAAVENMFQYPRDAQRDEENREDGLPCGLKKLCSR